MTLAACALMLLASVMTWGNENATVVERNNEYFATSYAAEAATEKVLASLSQEYQNYSFAGVTANLPAYQTTLPSASDGSYWTNFQFSGGHTLNQIIVTNTVSSQTVVEGAPYTGLTLAENTYEIIANAVNTNTEYQVMSTVGQQLYLGTIPLFQFAIFYQQDMEIAPGAAMTITGLIHGNGNIYLEPQVTLTLDGTVSAVDKIYSPGEDPLDPSSRTLGSIVMGPSAAEDSYSNPLNLPVGTNTTGTVTNAANVYAILQPPPSSVSSTSQTGSNYLYNKADIIIMISNNNTISVTSGVDINSQATIISNSQWSSWLSTNGSFYDQRDALTVNQTVINVSNLVAWSATNSVLRPVLTSYRGSAQADVESVYVDDMRSTSNAVVSTNTTTTTSYPSAGTYIPPVTTNKNSHGTITGYTYATGYTTNWSITSQPGVVLSNGNYLPPQGLSVATPDPSYIIGNWNTQLAAGGTSDAGGSNTQYSLPSAIYSDAITILSSAWNPANSTAALSSRTATSDTVNAAFLTGNVPSDGTYYSGGVENFVRFLENWSGDTFTYNGSMVCMFPSEIADAPWPGTGTVYNPPTRNWGFDNNFSNPSKMPPMTPQVITLQRNRWTLLSPYSTVF
jgi:hypothetical protein